MAPLHVDGSRFRGCHPSHLSPSPLRQSKLLAGRTFTPSQLMASHLRGWGSRLKQTTGSPLAFRLTSERAHGTITIGVPTLIQFVLGLPALTFIYQYGQKICLKRLNFRHPLTLVPGSRSKPFFSASINALSLTTGKNPRTTHFLMQFASRKYRAIVASRTFRA